MIFVFPGLLLHGEVGGLDEFIMLLVGIVVAFGVVAVTERHRRRRGQSSRAVRPVGETPGHEKEQRT